jgi:hypothetical protein
MTTRKSRISPADFQRHNPFREPDWRWRAATEALQQRRRLRRCEDSEIKKCLKYLLALDWADTDACRLKVHRRWPELAAAREIYLLGGVRRDELEARLLSDQTISIQQKMGISAGIVDAYVSVFFDVATSRDASDWIMLNVIGIDGWKSAPPTEGEVWKYLGFVAGPNILEVVISDYQDRPTPDYPYRHLVAERARFMVNDFASFIRTGRTADPVMLREVYRLFPHFFQLHGGIREHPTLKNQVDFLRFIAGLPPLEIPRPQSPTCTQSGTVASDIQTNEKEFAYG